MLLRHFHVYLISVYVLYSCVISEIVGYRKKMLAHNYGSADKHETLTQCWPVVGPASETLAQQRASIVWTCRLSWATGVNIYFACGVMLSQSHSLMSTYWKINCRITKIIKISSVPTNTRRWTNADFVLDQWWRRWPCIGPVLVHWLVLACVSCLFKRAFGKSDWRAPSWYIDCFSFY